MSTFNDARESLGELLLIGINGLELSDDSAAFLSQAKIGGVLLFAKNYENPAQVQRLCAQIQECRTELPLWTAVDQEGGRVQRFKTPFTIIPPALKIAAKDSPKLLFEISEMMAKELRAVGINLNFAPVADIWTNPKNEVIGDRAFGRDEASVTKFVTPFVRGHLTHHIQACVKHFPGHGDTVEDSHYHLPKVHVAWEELRERELRPFVRAFKSHCGMVMTAHILNTAIDEKYPATFSRKTLVDLLRGELRFSKVIISDDLEMQAISDHFGAGEAPILALNAGCDLLIYRSEGAARKAYEAMVKALEAGTLSPETILTAAKRCRDLKTETFEAYQAPTADDLKIIGCEEHKKLVVL